MKADQNKIWAKIVAKAWADENYKRRLLDNPAEVLKEEGLDMPEGWEIKVLEASEKQALLVLPPQPEGSVKEGEERLAAEPGFSISRCH